jgi:hypothetical protein
MSFANAASTVKFSLHSAQSAKLTEAAQQIFDKDFTTTIASLRSPV